MSEHPHEKLGRARPEPAAQAEPASEDPFERLVDPGVSSDERENLTTPYLPPPIARPPMESSPQLKRHIDAYQKLLGVSRQLSSILNHGELLDAILDAVIPLFNAQRGMILLREGESLRVARGRDLEQEHLPADIGQISHTLAGQCLSENRIVEFDQLSTPEYKDIQSIRVNQLFSAVCCPLRRQKDPFGVLYLDSSNSSMTPAALDREILEAFAAQAAISLINSELIRDIEDRRVILARENEELRTAVQGGWQFASLIGRSEEMQTLFEKMRLVKDLDLSVVLIGESGTGKELVAQALHSEGGRSKSPFVPVNCGAIPGELFESEFFGHIMGAFTQAVKDRPGLVEQADGGTLFLDEIGDLPREFQPKLLRFLESGEFRRVGENRTRHSSVRVVSATHRDLRKMVSEGTFRQDLYYRLNGMHIDLPPLRDRREDIPLLIDHFFTKTKERFKRDIQGMTNRALKSLMDYQWPGNVRQLRHVIEGACALVREGESLDVAHLQLHLPDLKTASVPANGVADESMPKKLHDAVTAAERQCIRQSLERNDWVITKAAGELGISRQHLHNRLRLHGLVRPGR